MAASGMGHPFSLALSLPQRRRGAEENKKQKILNLFSASLRLCGKTIGLCGKTLESIDALLDEPYDLLFAHLFFSFFSLFDHPLGLFLELGLHALPLAAR